MTERFVGQPLKRVEDGRFVRGVGRYVDDIRPDGVLHMAVLRSPYGHARIASIDCEAARQQPGVEAIFTAADFPDLKPLPGRANISNAAIAPIPIVASDRVRFVGEIVAVVVARSRYEAEDALRAIEADYEPLPAVTDAEAALASGSPRIHDEIPGNECYRLLASAGDVEGAFARAAHIVHARARHHRLAPVPMEPRCGLAEPAPDGGIQLTLSSQAPHRARDTLSACLGLPTSSIRVIAPDVGGGFGSKGSAYREDILLAALALRLQRAVTWTATRMEDLLTTHHARDQVDTIDGAFDDLGHLTAIRTRTVNGIGAYAYANTGQPQRIRDYATGAYKVPAHEAEIIALYTNTAPQGAYRGAGRPEASYLTERLMDQASLELGVDPVELRKRNLLQPGDFPWKTPNGANFDSGNYPALLDKALSIASYPELLRQRDERRARGEIVGVGIAVFIETTANGWESGAVEITDDGSVIGTTGSHSHGQGHETVFAQVLADELGVPVERVAIRHGDTALIDKAIGTFGSRSATLGGGALVQAAGELKDDMRTLAAELLETDAADLEIAEGAVRVRGTVERSVAFDQLAQTAEQRGERLAASTIFQPPNDAISSGAYVAQVSIDRDTGRVKLERIVAVDDCGTILNPMIVKGQVHGALAQGIGEAMSERMVYDADGQVLTASLLDYAMPTAHSVPEPTLGHIVTPNPSNPLGAKGAGEAGTIGAPPTIMNAVLDALRPLGVRDLDLPITDEKVWQAMQAAARS
jgi:aerobic carbon-monoxide dehydrogenase large subunit